MPAWDCHVCNGYGRYRFADRITNTFIPCSQCGAQGAVSVVKREAEVVTYNGEKHLKAPLIEREKCPTCLGSKGVTVNSKISVKEYTNDGEFLCQTCDGTGRLSSPDRDDWRWTTCSKCKGKGRTMFFFTWHVCDLCDGKGGSLWQGRD